MFKIFNRQKTTNSSQAMFAVTDGSLIPLENVADPVFSQKMLGDGVAIIPKNENIVAPCDGEITLIYPTLHAFGIRNNEGVEVLIHIGIDTVNLKGKGFKQFVKVHDKVHAGERIIAFNEEYLLEEKYDFTTMMIFPNCDKKLDKKNLGYVRKGKDIVITYE